MEEFWRVCMGLVMGRGGGAMMFFMLLFWTGVIAAMGLGIRWLWRQGRGLED